MISEETEELFSQLSEAGYEPRICENDIPTFLNPVHCGPATEIGDVSRRDDEWYSRDLIERNQKFKITAIGDSMQDAGINAGDDLVIQKGVTPMDGDILLVNILDKFQKTPIKLPETPMFFSKTPIKSPKRPKLP